MVRNERGQSWKRVNIAELVCSVVRKFLGEQQENPSGEIASLRYQRNRVLLAQLPGFVNIASESEDSFNVSQIIARLERNCVGRSHSAFCTHTNFAKTFQTTDARC